MILAHRFQKLKEVSPGLIRNLLGIYGLCGRMSRHHMLNFDGGREKATSIAEVNEAAGSRLGA